MNLVAIGITGICAKIGNKNIPVSINRQITARSERSGRQCGDILGPGRNAMRKQKEQQRNTKNVADSLDSLCWNKTGFKGIRVN